MQRIAVVIVCVGVGAIAIIGAIRELNEVPNVTSSAGAQEEEGPARSVVVRIDDFEFNPRSVSIRGGNTVEWSNDDDVAHTVTKVGREGEDFGSARISPGETYSHGFVEEGEYRYRCSIHPDRMSGRVVVLGD